MIAAVKTDVVYTAYVKWGKIFNLERERREERRERKREREKERERAPFFV